MQKLANRLRFSASDLVGHLDCRHLTALDAAVAGGSAQRPKIWDPVLEALVARGRAHEQEYVEHLRKQGMLTAAGFRANLAAMCGLWL